MLKKGESVYFINYYRKMDMFFVIYVDFELVMRFFYFSQLNFEKFYMEKKMVYIFVSFCYYVKCFFDNRFLKFVEYIVKLDDEDVVQIFVDRFEEEVKLIYKDYFLKKMIFRKRDRVIYEKFDSCWICGGEFSEDDEKDCKF